MNEDLIAEIQALSAIGSEEKFSEIIRLLKNSTLELRGKKNPDLQLSASALVFNYFLLNTLIKRSFCFQQVMLN